jgi:hypothetical protein
MSASRDLRVIRPGSSQWCVVFFAGIYLAAKWCVGRGEPGKGMKSWPG